MDETAGVLTESGRMRKSPWLNGECLLGPPATPVKLEDFNVKCAIFGDYE